MRTHLKSPLTLGLVLSLVLALAVAALPAADATSSSAPSSHARATAGRTVAENPKGSMTARIVGSTAGGKSVSGTFVPLRFTHKNGHVRVRGLINGVVKKADGTRQQTFAGLRTLRVKSINGTPATTARTAAGTAAARATCDILHLVLAPLDLNLLGLKVHLDRVVLDIVAVSGAGNLLGNLLCAVAGLLDGGLQGALGRLTNLLNQILGVLRLGV